MKKNDSIKSIVVLVSICIVVAVLMAAVNMITAPRIEAENAKKESEALSQVLTENGGFEQIESGAFSDTISSAWRDMDGEGYAFMLSVKGYDSSKPMVIAVGISNDGRITKCVTVSASGETKGIGSKVSEAEFTDRFSGKDSSLSGVDAISGATISTKAYIDAVKEALAAFETLGEVAK